uniref:Uncharacterized protein n=1 Tax=Arcella intermedia TaxID=1963864 RepID=A0A6B2LBY6_9EUKA
MDGKVVLITGANTGIGKETARVLAKAGATVYMICRDAKRGGEARAHILQELGEKASERVVMMQCDLGSLESIQNFALAWREVDLPIDILINNAGIMACPKSTTVDGFETQFGVNHLGHFLLTNLLIPYLKRSGKARVVSVSSMAHKASGIRFDVCGKTDVYDEFFGHWTAYGISKTANILFALELDKRYKDAGIRSNALHPGTIATELGRNNMGASLFYTVGSLFCKSVPEGAATSVLVAVAPQLDDVGGYYFSDCNITPQSAHAANLADAQRLWEESEKWVNLQERFNTIYG